jgi:hypothetical protein
VHSITDDPIASYDGDFTKYVSLLCVSVNTLHILYILQKFPTLSTATSVVYTFQYTAFVCMDKQ